MLRHRKIGVLVALFLSIWTAVAAAAPYAYITNSGTGSVSIIDIATQMVVASAVGGSPLGVALTPDGSKAYMTDGINVLVFDTVTKGVIKTLAVNSWPFGVAVSPDGSKAYVTRHLSFSLTSDSLAVINTADDTVAGYVKAGRLPMGVAVHPDGTKVYVATANGLNIVNGSTVTTKEAGSRPFGVTVNGSLKRVYVTSQMSNEVHAFDATTDDWIGKAIVESSPQGIAVSPNGKRVFVANNGSDSISILDAETLAVLGHYPVGTNPYGLQVTPDGKYVYVANWGSNSISVVDANSGALVQTIGLPTNSKPIAFGTFIQPIQPMTGLAVDIDIMPGGNPNMINLRAQGTLPVAILGSAEFNVATVDPATVTLAGAGVVMRKNGPMASMDDVNGDGSVDLVVHVARKDLKLQVGDTEAVLEGKTYDGLAIRGTDSVVVIH